MTLLEASKIGGGSSGKAGGLIADWATPKCLPPLSFQKHAELAKIHGGDKLWGHRPVYCADVRLEARNLNAERQPKEGGKAEGPSHPSAFDRTAPGVLKHLWLDSQ